MIDIILASKDLASGNATARAFLLAPNRQRHLPSGHEGEMR